MKARTLLLCTIALSLGGYAAHGESSTSGPRYTPRPEVSPRNYTGSNHVEDRVDAKSYRQYEQREPCQNYRRLPRDYAGGDCVESIEVATLQNPSVGERLLPIIHSYTVLFDFDKSAVRPDEYETLNQAMREISKYDPRQITVTGYTDSSGRVAYNQDLSRSREQAVSSALLQRGIENQALDRNARGEYDQAVKTADGIRNQQNRRVVIDFRR